MGAEKNNKPADGEAKPAKAEDDSKPQPWWFSQPNPIDRFTGWLVIWTFFLSVGTFGLAIVAVLQWRELHKTDETLRDTLLASQRAWLAPFNAVVIGDFESGKESRFQVSYRNVGREPASNIKRALSIAWPKKGQNPQWHDSCLFATNDTEAVLTAYPSEQIGYTVEVNLKNIPAFEILSGEQTLHLSGCLAYDTFGARHYSKFCFYWVHEEGKPLKEWKWLYCPTGNEAD